MSRWRLERAPRVRHVWGVDAQGLAWHTADAPDGVRLAEHSGAPERALANATGARVIDVIAANELAVHWLQRPPAATRSLDELKLVAAARCAHLYGGTLADWWIAGDWHLRRPFVCAAVPRHVAEPLQRACQAQGTRLRWHSAWGIVCSARAGSFPDDGWSAMRSAWRVLLWHCSGGHVDAITPIATTPEMSSTEIDAALEVQMKLQAAADSALAPSQVHWTAPASGGLREAVDVLALGALLEQAA